MKPHLKIILTVLLFSVAMAALESAVVVYLRALYYPDGFSVAFKLIDEKILGIEIVRELATLIMLLTVGFLAGKNPRERLAYFLLSFAVWDIFYYVWLKIFLDWPSSFFEWDILFLIPITWLGPVLAPLICSLTMIAFAAVLLKFSDERITPLTSVLLLTGSLLVLATFMQDYFMLLWSNDLWEAWPNLLTNENFFKLASVYVPAQFNWLLFSLGEVFLAAAIFVCLKRNRQ